MERLNLKEMHHIKVKDEGEHQDVSVAQKGGLSPDNEDVHVHEGGNMREQRPLQGQIHHERSDREKSGVGPDDERVRIFEEGDKSGMHVQQHKTTTLRSSTHIEPVVPNRRPLHEENTGESVEKVNMVSTTQDEPVEEKRAIETETSRPVHGDYDTAEKVQPQPSPRSPREHLYEPEHIDEEKSGKGGGIKDKIMSALTRMMGGKESDKDSVTEGREVRDEPITEGSKTTTASEHLGMPSGTTTVHGSTDHSKITATVTETGDKKTITVTEHVQKKGIFGSSGSSEEQE